MVSIARLRIPPHFRTYWAHLREGNHLTIHICVTIRTTVWLTADYRNSIIFLQNFAIIVTHTWHVSNFFRNSKVAQGLLKIIYFKSTWPSKTFSTSQRHRNLVVSENLSLSNIKIYFTSKFWLTQVLCTVLLTFSSNSTQIFLPLNNQMSET